MRWYSFRSNVSKTSKQTSSVKYVFSLNKNDSARVAFSSPLLSFSLSLVCVFFLFRVLLDGTNLLFWPLIQSNGCNFRCCFISQIVFRLQVYDTSMIYHSFFRYYGYYRRVVMEVKSWFAITVQFTPCSPTKESTDSVTFLQSCIYMVKVCTGIKIQSSSVTVFIISCKICKLQGRVPSIALVVSHNHGWLSRRGTSSLTKQ